ncbi:MAG: serine hydrolase domain-containing protein [Agrobacterium sp.]|nr:serine hydrolase domain-containing protein [Agrobacterium sp.]
MKRLLKTLGIIAAFALIYILIVVLYQTRPWVSAESIPADVDLQRESRTFALKHQPIAQIWDRQLPLWRQQSHAPSLSIAVGHGGELIWAGAIGYKDLARKIPAQLDTRYRIGSTSKALTATGLARLYDSRAIIARRPHTRLFAELSRQ